MNTAEDVLIILPVSNAVLFPGVVLPIAIEGKASIAAENVLAIAIRPKSAGTRMRASTSVLSRPSTRVTMRQATIHAAPVVVLRAIESAVTCWFVRA